MSSGVVDYTPHGRDGFEATLRTPRGSLLTVSGVANALQPEVVGDRPLRDNPALVSLLWAVGTHEWQYRRTRSAELRTSHRPAADRRTAEAILLGRMIDQLSADRRGRIDAWCSACFTQTRHVRVTGFDRPLWTYLCTTCGAATSRCAAPSCKAMATRRLATVSSPRYCAEHRHDIPSFGKLSQTLGSIDEYRQWLSFEKFNLARVSRIAGVAVVTGLAVTPAAFALAPAVGGAVGAVTGLSGVAATSHGLDGMR